VRHRDASGGTRKTAVLPIEQTFSAVPPFERDYFEFDELPVADRYGVTVYSYEKASQS
jgi:hypothetical protein